MARRELGPAALAVSQAVARMLPDDAVIGCSGGADSLALALGAGWAAARAGAQVHCVIVDHGLQAGSDEVAERVRSLLIENQLSAEVVRVSVDTLGQDGLEAAAREARLAALSQFGRPVLLGHTMDDQAESVLLGLLRGSGPRSLAGMRSQRDQFLRPLLGLRRATTQQACREWGASWWDDPHNNEARFARVRARDLLTRLSAELDRDLVPALARSADLARVDVDYLDELADVRWHGLNLSDDQALSVDVLAAEPGAIRLRLIRRWLVGAGLEPVSAQLQAIDDLICRWRGQGPVNLAGACVARRNGRLTII